MKSKIRTIISLGIIGVVVLGMTLIILLNGSKNGGFNYARIDCGISVEFVTNNKGNVVAYRPLNNDARFALAGLDIEGEKIKFQFNESFGARLLNYKDVFMCNECRNKRHSAHVNTIYSVI
jgi:hypothetical protein